MSAIQSTTCVKRINESKVKGSNFQLKGIHKLSSGHVYMAKGMVFGTYVSLIICPKTVVWGRTELYKVQTPIEPYHIFKLLIQL